MNQRVALILLAISTVISGWLFWGSDVKVEQVLTAREWQTNLDAFVHTDQIDESLVGPLRKVHITSNVKYLPNGEYIRSSRVQLLSDNDQEIHILNIDESGVWQLSDNYLLIDLKEFKQSTGISSQDFKESQLTIIKQILRTDAQQSRRVDIINDNSILLTSLGHGSRVLVSAPSL
ncbi:regulatory protein ToxS [Vibrio neonatus]|uniref:regulatory protein ToxS n=1 Tax=Vibrio neonatus TaxID=278860 RepID=UPI0021C2E1BE|nr:regulatory protein ToxS [Vibrio neonatus]